MAAWILTTEVARVRPGQRDFVEYHTRLGYTGVHSGDRAVKPGGEFSVTRQSEGADETMNDSYRRAFQLFASAGIQMLGLAESRWQNGYCVEVVLSRDRHLLVDPSSTTTFTATVRHKFEGRDIQVPVQATLSGDQSIQPTAKTNTPVDYTYVAGDKPERTATVNLETRSRWGVGKTGIQFTTTVLPWRPVSPWQGSVCYLDEPFTISMGGLVPETFGFTPKGETSGTVAMTQQIGGGCEVRGTGTYTIEVTEGEETEADIRIDITPTVYCQGMTAPREATVLHILLEPYDDPACE